MSLRTDIEVDFARQLGEIRRLNGVSGGPLADGGMINLSDWFRKLKIPAVRTHDAYWPFGDVIDIHCVFPDADADPQDPANYSFSRTDDYIQAIIDIGAQVVYRLGYSIEIDSLGGKYLVHNVPPANYEKFADVCLNIVRHYNDGWADGFRHGITHWEVWCEPDLAQFWTGTVEEFGRLYEMVARRIKKAFPNIKIGGPSLAHRMEFFEPWLAYCRDHDVPIDFCSWHCYTTDPDCLVDLCGQYRAALDKHGYEHAEGHLNEWNYIPSNCWNQFQQDAEYAHQLLKSMASAEAAAYVATVLARIQDTALAMANFYSGDTSIYGLFERAERHGYPKKTVRAFEAFAALLDTPVRVAAVNQEGQSGVTAIAGIAPDGNAATIMIAALRADRESCEISLKNEPWSAADYTIRVLDEDNDLGESSSGTLGEANDRTVTFPMSSSGVYLLSLEQRDT